MLFLALPAYRSAHQALTHCSNPLKNAEAAECTYKAVPSPAGLQTMSYCNTKAFCLL